MMASSQYLEELTAERDNLDATYYVNAVRLLEQEIKRIESGKTEANEKDDLDVYNNNTTENDEDKDAEAKEAKKKEFFRKTYEFEVEPNIKLSEKVKIPVKKYPKFNFVGRLLGPKGYTFKRLQNMTGCKMSILGKGSMRDKEKEKELLESGDAKYLHLQEELHVLIEVEAPKAEAHGRLASAISEVQKFLIPDPNDPIRQEQMRELAYLNGLDENSPAATPSAAPVITSSVIRGRPRGRGVAVRSAHVVRGVIPRSAVAAVSTPRHGATAPDSYAYETYEGGYEYQEGDVVYYADYPAAETYPSTSTTVRLKAPLRSMKSAVRESTYPY